MRIEDPAICPESTSLEELEKLSLVPMDGYAGMFADAPPPTLEDRLGRMPAALARAGSRPAPRISTEVRRIR